MIVVSAPPSAPIGGISSTAAITATTTASALAISSVRCWCSESSSSDHVATRNVLTSVSACRRRTGIEGANSGSPPITSTAGRAATTSTSVIHTPTISPTSVTRWTA
jgi:hypothetical protein